MTSYRSELVRIGSSYARLLAGFLIGILLVRQLLSYGTDIFNIYTIITVGAGIGTMLRELIRIALVPHLSAAWTRHRDEPSPEVFRRIYASGFHVSTITAAFGLLLMGTVAHFLDQFAIEPENLSAALAFLAARAVIMVISVTLSPLLSMLPVTQQFSRSNLLLFLERFSDFVAAILPAFLLGAGASGAHALILFAIANVALSAMLYAITIVLMVRRQPLFLPTWRHFAWDRVKRVAVSAGWAAGLVLSINIYLRFDTFFVNLVFGAAATVAFGIAVQLIGMVRQMTNGLVSGLDAVVAKLGNGGQTTIASTRQLGETEVISFSSYLQAMLTGNALVFIILGAEQLISLWVGAKVDDPDIIRLSAQMTAIMLAGIGSSALAEGWMNALNGKQRIGNYVRYTLPISLLNPIILMCLWWLDSSLLTMQMVALCYALLLIIGNLLIIPAIYAHAQQEQMLALYRPILFGLLAPVIAGIMAITLLEILHFGGATGRLLFIATILALASATHLLSTIIRERRSRIVNR